MQIQLIISFLLELIISVTHGHYDYLLRSARNPSYATDKLYVIPVPQRYFMSWHKLFP
jgi:hypothetical protein